MSTLRRVAVIDCGTNTFNLRIVDLGAAAGWIPVFGQRIPVRLGQGGVAKGVIRPDRMARGLDALVSMCHGDPFGESHRRVLCHRIM